MFPKEQMNVLVLGAGLRGLQMSERGAMSGMEEAGWSPVGYFPSSMARSRQVKVGQPPRVTAVSPLPPRES